MRMEVVTSSVIDAISWDRSNLILEVRMRTGTRYEYAEVAAETWEAFRNSESKGEFYSKVIKPYHPWRPAGFNPPTSRRPTDFEAVVHAHVGQGV
jgi:hypothetical protein